MSWKGRKVNVVTHLSGAMPKPSPQHLSSLSWVLDEEEQKPVFLIPKFTPQRKGSAWKPKLVFSGELPSATSQFSVSLH